MEEGFQTAMMVNESAAHTRANELVLQFERDPDRLSPDAQALVQAIKLLERAGQDVLRQIRQQHGAMIESMAESHYARDIRGELALSNWKGVAQMLRDLT